MGAPLKDLKICRLCPNALLTHGARAIGVCHDCIASEKTSKGIPMPGYFGRHDNATKETTGRG